jgi:hypothetical protein
MFFYVLSEDIGNNIFNNLDFKTYRNKNPFYLLPKSLLKYGLNEDNEILKDTIDKIMRLNYIRVLFIERLLFNSKEDIDFIGYDYKEFGHLYYVSNKYDLIYPAINNRLEYSRFPYGSKELHLNMVFSSNQKEIEKIFRKNAEELLY